ncbi:MAG: type II toxin-antitoxin system PemK/MazF family toxin [Deltaproteobacteria bacterium]|nr:type II toxin-antitoxin system PemK/MazF family toxin [Deltaproteobacteria bacterium]
MSQDDSILLHRPHSYTIHVNMDDGAHLTFISLGQPSLPQAAIHSSMPLGIVPSIQKRLALISTLANLKKRPVVVLNEGHKKYLRLAIVVPITGWAANWATNPFFVSLFPDDMNGLQTKSAVDCFQVRTISHDRFLGKIGSIPVKEMDLIKKAMALILDIDSEHCE